ncbi:SET domain-containing protein SmydA-8 isoform X1 [Lepeophtheirus salmonis]|uniref:SET domain-containing protein SmydA-8 isoform X1 n=2 Tax=Lepeophtheirus salmonis TaxID=72036 RepID=UPI001AE8804E|nr:SET domain-containing protein SmydA-8-like [Lepeophtheirus salmonis]
MSPAASNKDSNGVLRINGMTDTKNDVDVYIDMCCFFCGNEEEEDNHLTLCPFCKIVYYCSEDHSIIHRHTDRCFPFIVRKSKSFGRYMIAARDINPLELILSEQPAVVGPYSKKLPGCLNCFRLVDDSYHCSKCGVPVCDKECEIGDLHRPECSYFQANNFVIKNENRYSSQTCVTPLRMLLMKKSDPNTFRKMDMLMDHIEERAVINQQVNIQLLNIILFLKEVSSPKEFNQKEVSTSLDFDQKEIQRMLGILKTNGMKFEPLGPEKGCPGVALYPVYCLINHACFNNTNYVKFPDFHLELRSQIPIKKGEQIFTRYVSSTIGNVRRREDIKQYWFFDCECQRCTDRTELGTYMSAINCKHCKNGYLLPVNSLSYKSDWSCNNCDVIVNYKTISDIIDTIESQVRSIEYGTIDELEEMLYHYQKLLHPNHYIVIDIMHNLIHGYAAKETCTRPEKERKIQLCMSVLETLGRVDPGYTKWRGAILQEMIYPLMMISKEDHEYKRITEREFHKRLNICARKLAEARKCLTGGFTKLNENSVSSILNKPIDEDNVSKSNT